MRAIGRRRAAYVQNVLVVGSGYVAHMLTDKIDKHPEYGLRVVGYVDRDDRAVANGNGKNPLIGTTDDLPRLVHEHSVHRVVIAFSTDSHDQTLEVIRSMQDTDVQIDIVPRMFEVLGTNAQMHTIEGVPLVGLPAPRLSGSSRLLKRSLDLTPRPSGSSYSPRCSPSSRFSSSWTREGLSSGRCGWAPGGGLPGLQVPNDGRQRRGAEAERRI